METIIISYLQFCLCVHCGSEVCMFIGLWQNREPGLGVFFTSVPLVNGRSSSFFLLQWSPRNAVWVVQELAIHTGREPIFQQENHISLASLCVCLRAVMGRGKKDAPKVPGEELKFDAISGASFAMLPVKHKQYSSPSSLYCAS